MQTVTPQKILLGIVALVAGFGVLFGAWKMSSKPTAAQKFDITLTEKDHTQGQKNAKVVLVEYSDFQCPTCKLFEPVVKEVLKKNEDRILFIYRHFPLVNNHKNAKPSAMAAEAAAKQGKFFEMHDKLFENQEDWAESDNAKEKFIEYAKELKLNTKRFEQDLTAADSTSKIDADMQTGISYRVNGTPTFFLNGERIEELPRSADEFNQLIESKLSQ